MITAQQARRAGLRAAATVLTLSVFFTTARADMSWRVHDAGEVLASYTRPGESGLVFDDPAGGTWDLVTTIEDPAILNRGSGSFHPVDARVVEEALRNLDPDLPGVADVEIYLLPFPRRGLLASSADRGRIYLSPGTHPATDEQVHALVVHELGHVVHQRLLPDSDVSGWSRYRALRGIEDVSRYHDRAAHRNRPHEIFAEDFRALFGGDRANYSRTIENADLAYSSSVYGLREFMAGLAKTGTGVELAAWPNPLRHGGFMTIRFDTPHAGSALRLDILDAGGRLVRRFNIESREQAVSVAWDGRDEDGWPVASGIYFARIAAGLERTVRRLVVAR